MAPNGRKKTHDLYPYTKFFIQTLFIKNRKNLSESDQRSIHAWSNSKKKNLHLPWKWVSIWNSWDSFVQEWSIFYVNTQDQTDWNEWGEATPPFCLHFPGFPLWKKRSHFSWFFQKRKKEFFKILGKLWWNTIKKVYLFPQNLGVFL